ncbi:MAG: hypothetical protein ACFFG0_45215 [Candidatus Thorarchaeota archaeon]
MELNWNIEVFVDFLVAAVGLLLTITSYYTPKAKKIKSLFLIRLGFISFWVFMLLDGLAFLFLNEFIGQLNGLILIPAALFVIIGVNYTIKENFYSFGLFIVIGLSMLFMYVAIQPGAVETISEAGYIKIRWIGLFNIMGIILSGISMFYIFYWGVKTWGNAPFLIKREANIFLLGINFIFPSAFIFYIFYVINPILILFTDFFIMIGVMIITYCILKEPKLLYILPFTIYRIVVKDRQGRPLYDHDWSESKISENIFASFLNAVQLMSEEAMHIGGVLDINLEGGILILKESVRITVGLVASKSSKLLRDSVVNFTEDFENKFDRELKLSIDNMTPYFSAYELIEKYFSNFPYKMIKSKKQPLLLAGEYLKIPQELDGKLRNIFTDEKEYDAIKAELVKSPLSISSDFMKSYNEMLQELQQISADNVKYLDTEPNLDR